MSNIQTVNLFLKNEKGDLYRIYKISHGNDKYGENYFKVMVPDLIGRKIYTHKTSKYIKPPDLKAFFSSKRELNIDLFHEYTYHYESGVAHFKNNRGNHLYQIKNLPVLHENKFLNFIRFIIHDLSRFKVYKGRVTENDLVLELPLNNLGRLINLYLLENVNIKIVNDDERVSLIGSYKINVEGTSKYLIVQEFCYVQPQLKEDRIGFSLFVFNDTAIKLQSKEIKSL
ncbi:MAG TPA: hypothetical protein VI795_01990 [Patescibacteria group bacterium]|nr:hypothetical protein [Patescibacteria group bacterium]